MDEKPEDYYRVFAPGVPNVRVMSERLTEAEAQAREWGIPLHNSRGTTTHAPVSNPSTRGETT